MAKKRIKRFQAAKAKKESFKEWFLPIFAILVVIVIAGFFLFGSSPENNKDNNQDLVGEGHIKGNPNAGVTVVEFSDFQCPACGAAFSRVQTVFEQYKDRIRFVYRHFPLTTLHPFAVTAAEASECAAEQNHFWEMHNALFQNQSVWSTAGSADAVKESIRDLAHQLGLGLEAYDACMQSRRNLSKVQADLDAAVRLGLNSTPTFFINGQKFSGALSVEAFSQQIENALARS